MNASAADDPHLLVFSRLRDQHLRIHAVADALDRFVARAEVVQSLDPYELIQFLAFIRGYVDGYHYELEEKVLLSALARTGFGALERGPLAHIREEHRDEGDLVRNLEMAACAPGPWQDVAIGSIAGAARTLTAFERAHMLKEDRLFFPAAEAAFDAHDAQALSDALKRFERVRISRWNVRWLERLAHRLVTFDAS